MACTGPCPYCRLSCADGKHHFITKANGKIMLTIPYLGWCWCAPATHITCHWSIHAWDPPPTRTTAENGDGNEAEQRHLIGCSRLLRQLSDWPTRAHQHKRTAHNRCCSCRILRFSIRIASDASCVADFEPRSIGKLICLAGGTFSFFCCFDVCLCYFRVDEIILRHNTPTKLSERR